MLAVCLVIIFMLISLLIMLKMMRHVRIEQTESLRVIEWMALRMTTRLSWPFLVT